MNQMECLEEKYQFYQKHVPRSASTLFGHSSIELDRIRKEIIKSHRIISISNILVNSEKENKNKYGLSKLMTSDRKFVLNPQILDASSNINPILVHQSTALFNLIHSNTSNLVDALLKYKKLIPAFSTFSLASFNDPNSSQNSETFLFKTSSANVASNSLKEFNYLALSAIPSLFGYYSSNEHINLSMGFFVKLFNSTDCLPLVLPFLMPFFSAPCLYRYFESSLAPFFDYFVRDTQQFNNNVIIEYSIKLTEFFVSNAPLVPHTHVVLLRLMHARWGELATCYFFCEVLLKKHTFQWLESVSTEIPKELIKNSKAKNKNKNKDMCEGDLIAREIIEKIFKNLNQSKILYSVLQTESLIEVPFQYTVFEDPFLYFLVSISDVRALYHLFIKENHKTLKSMKIIDTEMVDENAVYWMKTYPPHQMETQLTRVPLIFQNDDFKAPEDEVKERRWRAIENLADERDVDPMQIVNEINNKKKRETNLQSQILRIQESKSNAKDNDEFTNYAISMSLANSIESAEIFEQFLLQMYNLESSKKWQKISSFHEYIISLPIVKAMVILNEKETIQSNIDSSNYKKQCIDLFIKASENLHSPTIKRYQYLFIIQRIVPKVLKGSEDDFEFIKEKVDENFQRHLSLLDSLNSNLNKTKSSIFWETVELFRTMQCNDLPYQFTNLMRGLSLIYHISINTKNTQDGNSDDKDEDTSINKRAKMFILHALSLSSTDKILYLYMVIAIFAMSDDRFRCLCTEQEHRLWVIFQALMLEIILSDAEASEKYAAIICRFKIE